MTMHRYIWERIYHYFRHNHGTTSDAINWICQTKAQYVFHFYDKTPSVCLTQLLRFVWDNHQFSAVTYVKTCSLCIT
jgi:hypothetical protein